MGVSHKTIFLLKEVCSKLITILLYWNTHTVKLEDISLSSDVALPDTLLVDRIHKTCAHTF